MKGHHHESINPQHLCSSIRHQRLRHLVRDLVLRMARGMDHLGCNAHDQARPTRQRAYLTLQTRRKPGFFSPKISGGGVQCATPLRPVPFPLAVDCAGHHQLTLHTLLPSPVCAMLLPLLSYRMKPRVVALQTLLPPTSYTSWTVDTCSLPVGRPVLSFHTV